MLEVEGIELLANTLQHYPSLQALLVARPVILRGFSFLLFRLLGPNNSLFSQGRLEAFELGSGHDGGR